MFNIHGEVFKGPFGTFKKTFELGEVKKGSPETLTNGADTIRLTVVHGVDLVIRSLGEEPVRIDTIVPSEEGRRHIIHFLHPSRPEYQAVNPWEVIISSLTPGKRERLVASFKSFNSAT